MNKVSLNLFHILCANYHPTAQGLSSSSEHLKLEVHNFDAINQQHEYQNVSSTYSCNETDTKCSVREETVPPSRCLDGVRSRQCGTSHGITLGFIGGFGSSTKHPMEYRCNRINDWSAGSNKKHLKRWQLSKLLIGRVLNNSNNYLP